MSRSPSGWESRGTRSTRRSTTAIGRWRRSSVADVVALFEEYAAAYARGGRPPAREYLERAGAGADELAGLISAWLRAVPVPQPDADGTAPVGALAAAEPPLLALRVEQGVRVEEVVDALVDGLELDRAKRGKVKRYYQRLEHG